MPGLEASLTIRDRKINFVLDMVLHPLSPTHVEAESLMDLTRTEAMLTEVMSGSTVVDVCGFRAEVEEISVTARGDVVGPSGRMKAEDFICERLAVGAFQRGELRRGGQLDFAAVAPAALPHQRIEFRITNLRLRPTAGLDLDEDAERTIEAARALMLEAANLVLSRQRLCPEFAMLDSRYGTGQPEGIGDGVLAWL